MTILENGLYVEDLKKAVSKLDLSQASHKSFIVTGGLGLICSTIVDLLIMANYVQNLNIRIYVAARNKIKFIHRYKHFKNVEFVEYDALKPVDFHFRVDYVIAGAGIASPEKYVSAPVETMLSNMTGVKNLLEYSKENGIKRLCYISSSEIYGEKEIEGNFHEGVYGAVDLDSIRSSYAVSKQASELLCKSYTTEYGVDTVIVRPGHVFGPAASKKDKRIASDFAFKAAEMIPLEMKSSGLQKRSYCYSIDAATAILIVLLRGRSGQAYNICTDEVLTIREMAAFFAETGGVSLSCVQPTKEELDAFNPMKNSALSFDKLSSLGFQKSFTVREGINHTVKILRAGKAK